ncbi:MIP aquaporin (TC 1.A.8) [Ancistrocladus abbreviatus]
MAARTGERKPNQKTQENRGIKKVEKIRVLISDFIISMMWVCSGPLINLFVQKNLGIGKGHHLHGHESPTAEIMKEAVTILNLFVFAYLGKVSKGGAYNPLTVLAAAVTEDFDQSLFILGARIPAQVFGSIYGVRFLINTIPEIGRGPKLNVDIHWGALTEGLLAFSIVTVSLGLTRSIPGSFFRKTWISSVSKVILHILGSDLTGGCMNPASAMGWAYARGDHITKDHIVVYWLAPVVGTLFAVLIFRLLFQTQKKGKEGKKTKSE